MVFLYILQKMMSRLAWRHSAWKTPSFNDSQHNESQHEHEVSRCWTLHLIAILTVVILIVVMLSVDECKQTCDVILFKHLSSNSTLWMVESWIKNYLYLHQFLVSSLCFCPLCALLSLSVSHFSQKHLCDILNLIIFIVSIALSYNPY